MKSKLNIVLFIGAFVLTALSVMLINRFRDQNAVASEGQIFLRQGFDFRQQRLLNKSLEPGLGSKISLVDLQTPKGEEVSSVLNGSLLLLAVVDPDCSACEYSRDMMENVRKNANELGIKYLPIVSRKLPSEVNIQRYGEALGFETCLQWASEAPAPESLRIGTPSHILTSKDGVILQVWRGTNADHATRIRMSNQISSDLYLINDVVRAIKTSK
jgi:hypothetical protein